MRPSQGRIVERECTPDDRSALDEKTQARRLSIPQEMAILPRKRLGRALTPEEVLYFAEMTRRVGGMLLVNYM